MLTFRKQASSESTALRVPSLSSTAAPRCSPSSPKASAGASTSSPASSFYRFDDRNTGELKSPSTSLPIETSPMRCAV